MTQPDDTTNAASSEPAPTTDSTPTSQPESIATDPVTLAFVCVQNAGRSQMAAAFARRERDRRGLRGRVRICTGGTHPAEDVHEVVVDAMLERGVDISDRTPSEITPGELASVDVVITMGCSASGVCPATWNGESRDWDLDDPHGRALEDVVRIRDEIERLVEELFDDIETGTVGEREDSTE
ncbi:Protein-tyrosine-phosphatase [Halalkaliarchaeum sp. AArc-CO]|uniref:arsenate-mycothiol transferase ArsC n=1 Tax=Halalkaliarchaeum sp. AArc-CO TaxID=2866381 RepID=UPI00217E6CAE|nr:low molecular weight phosphatase family protein [Halalkaliarchaeum sp. AArc-CO]UWG51713.1 Protein-tyrosine-phosphatase [Halalkaliarchaeum sp. AArc-CO]